MKKPASRLLQESQGKYSLFISPALISALGWKKGDSIGFTIGGKNKLELSKVE